MGLAPFCGKGRKIFFSQEEKKKTFIGLGLRCCSRSALRIKGFFVFS
jgi:hypothetical protein